MAKTQRQTWISSWIHGHCLYIVLPHLGKIRLWIYTVFCCCCKSTYCCNTLVFFLEGGGEMVQRSNIGENLGMKACKEGKSVPNSMSAHRQADTHVDIASYRLNQPRGHFSENPAFRRPLNPSMIADSSTITNKKNQKFPLICFIILLFFIKEGAGWSLSSSDQNPPRNARGGTDFVKIPKNPKTF